MIKGLGNLPDIRPAKVLKAGFRRVFETRVLDP
jgi:hypothetical protein